MGWGQTIALCGTLLFCTMGLADEIRKGMKNFIEEIDKQGHLARQEAQQWRRRK